MKKFFNNILSKVVRKILRIVSREHNTTYSDRWHPHNALRKEALRETVDYIKTNMTSAMIRSDAFGVLSYASRQVAIEGLILEFGVRTGRTINHIAKSHPNATIHGFDSFEGLPEDWTGWTQDKGTFARESMPQVEDNVRLVPGWFDETLEGFLVENSGDLAMVHIDSDLYSSAKTVLDGLASRIKPGSVIVFNEYFNYPNWQQHEFKAFAEFCESNEVEYTYLCWGLFEVAVKILYIKSYQ